MSESERRALSEALLVWCRVCWARYVGPLSDEGSLDLLPSWDPLGLERYRLSRRNHAAEVYGVR